MRRLIIRHAQAGKNQSGDTRIIYITLYIYPARDFCLFCCYASYTFRQFVQANLDHEPEG